MPQKPIVRRRQKARRSKQLAKWRENQASEQTSPSSSASRATKSKAASK